MTEEELQAAGVALALAARLLYNEPTDEDVSAYVQPGLFAEAPFAMEDDTVRAGLAAMDGWCRDAAAAAESDPTALHRRAADLRSDWLNLIAGAGEPKAPSWAGYYLNPSSAILGESALAVRRLYRRHGFEVERQNREPDDHLGLMLGFISLLIQREGEESATAPGADGVAGASSESDAAQCQAQLLQRFILPWLPLWRWSVERFARTEFYRGVGAMVFGLVRVYALRFGFRYAEDGEGPRFELAC